MAPLPTTYTVELHPDQVPTVWRFAGYDGNSPEDELASLIRSGIEVRIRRMRQERKTAALGTDCPLCGARAAGWPPSEGEPCRDWRPGGKARDRQVGVMRLGVAASAWVPDLTAW